jgi:hypothetical protein
MTLGHGFTGKQKVLKRHGRPLSEIQNDISNTLLCGNVSEDGQDHLPALSSNAPLNAKPKGNKNNGKDEGLTRTFCESFDQLHNSPANFGIFNSNKSLVELEAV